MDELKSKVHFISCIKVKGIHLLPPVITQKRHAELQGYKQQAIKLEKRLKNCRDLKKNLEDLLNMEPLTDRPYSEISFRGNSHVEALGITEKTDINLPSRTKAKRTIKLSKDIIDVTQYNSDGIKIIYNDSNSGMSHQDFNLLYNNSENPITNTPIEKEQVEILYKSPNINQDNSDTEKNDLNTSQLNKHNEGEQGFANSNSSESDFIKNTSPCLEKYVRPRLIRSNSYTLETPSPILLAHLEKAEKNNKPDEVKNHDIKRLSICRNWSSLENNYIPFENSEFSSINTVYKTNFDNPDKDIQSSTPIDSDLKNEQNSFEKSTSSAIKVIQTDITVQKITVDANNDIISDALDENSEISDSQLLQVLKTLPDIYAKQIIELIESQKLEKQKLAGYVEEPEKTFNTSSDRVPKKDILQKENENSVNNKNEELLLKSSLSSDHNNESGNTMHRSVSFSGSDKLQGSTTSISPSQSIYYSLTSSDTLRPVSNSSIRLFDFECDDTFPFNEKSEFPKETVIKECFVNEELIKGMSVSRELFPQLNLNKNTGIKQEWAASIIGAHVKGYLTRRLLNTERVQSLIEIIKDALMCALQLHNAENIDESDVELHRRLINQVSAACYTFHDIFFSLTVQEQMLIIATDRQHKIEKAKRPMSAPNVSRRSKSSTRTTPRQSVTSRS